MINERVATSIGLGVTQAITLWLALTPPLREVYQADGSNDEFNGAMRHAEMIAGGASLGVGLVGSMISGSTLPILVSLATVGVLYATYEYTLYSTTPTP